MAEPLNSIPSALDTWLTDLAATNRSAATIYAYRYAAEQFLDWLEDDDQDRLLSVTKREATAYAAWLGTQFKPGGNQARIRSLRVFYNWAIEDESYEGKNPFAKLMPKGEDKAMELPTTEEVEAMIVRAKNGPSKRDLAVVVMLITTGCRKGEIANLEVDDLDFDNRLISFRISKTRSKKVFMTDETAAALMKWLRQRPKNGLGLWASTAPYDLIDTIVVRASAGKWRSHSLRRYFAVNWMDQGGSESGLIRTAGWKDGTMLRHYIAARADVLAQAEHRRLMG